MPAAAGSRLQRMLHARCNHLSALPAALSSAWHCCPSRLTLRYCGLQVTDLVDLTGMNHAMYILALLELPECGLLNCQLCMRH